MDYAIAEEASSRGLAVVSEGYFGELDSGHVVKEVKRDKPFEVHVAWTLSERNRKKRRRGLVVVKF